MALVSIVSSLFLLCLAAAVIYTAYNLTRQFPLKFLTSYLYFLGFFYISGSLYFIGADFNVLLFQRSPESFQLTLQVILLLVAPADILFLFFFILWVTELFERKLPAGFKWGYFSVQIILFLNAVVKLKKLLDTQSVELAGPISTLRQTINAFAILLAILYLLLAAGLSPNAVRKGLGLRMGFFYLFGFVAFTFFADVIVLPFYSNSAHRLAFVAFLDFALNVPPLLVLRRFLKKSPSELGVVVPGASELEDYCAHHGLTSREKDIIELIMAGKDTKEIAKALYISTKTVKNNISKVFQKTHAKSRVQLLSFIEGRRIKHDG